MRQKMEEISKQISLIEKYVRDLKQAEDVNDWKKVVALSDKIQDCGHDIHREAGAIEKGMKN